jgi:hypothetical protein
MFFWEFIQNLPLVAGLMVAVQWWQAALLTASIGAMIAGSGFGALLIRLTEGNIVSRNQPSSSSGSREPVSVTITNIVLMFIFMLILTVYLTADWSSILIDLPLGGLIGFILSAGQSKAAGRAVSLRHSLAFTAAFPLALVTIRILSAGLPLLISILLITTVVTLIITFIDYGHLTSTKGGTN